MKYKQLAHTLRHCLLFASVFFANTFVGTSHATLLDISPVKQPLYILGSQGNDEEIQIMDVPYATFGAEPEWIFPAICSPFCPPMERGVQEAHNIRDVNLASLYKISTSGKLKIEKVLNEQGKEEYRVTDDIDVVIDISEAEVPKDYPFTIKQVTDAVASCIRQMLPENSPGRGKLEIKVRLPSDKLIDYSEYSKMENEEKNETEKSESK